MRILSPVLINRSYDGDTSVQCSDEQSHRLVKSGGESGYEGRT
jgi:hypothetical protein